VIDDLGVHVELIKKSLREINAARVLGYSQTGQRNVLPEKVEDGLTVFALELQPTFFKGNSPHLETRFQRLKHPLNALDRDICLINVQVDECAAFSEEAAQVIEHLVVDSRVLAQVQRGQLHLTLGQLYYEVVDVGAAKSCCREVQLLHILLSLDVLNDSRVALLRDLDASQAEGAL